MAGGVDMKMLGDKALDRAFATLPVKMQKTVARKAIRNSAKRTRRYIVRELLALRARTNRSGRNRLLTLAEFFENAKVVSRSKRARQLIRIGVIWPSRSDIGIPADAKGYFPTAIEYGTIKAPAMPYLRPAVDNNRKTELALIRREVARGIEAQFKKLTAKGAK